jgi:prophage regulatory protein
MVNDYQILRLPQVKAQTGLSRSSIYLRIAEGSFPKQVNLGGRAVGWDSNSIQDWIKDRLAESRMEG